MHEFTRLMAEDTALSATQPFGPEGADRAAPALPAALSTETVLAVRHWTERLFSFTLTRNPGFRFQSGQFTLLGLMVDGRPLLRPYSMASAQYDTALEFLSVKMANGPLTSRLRHIAPGATVLIGRKPTGTLVQDSLLPGRTLYLFAAGTGLAPFLSLVKDPVLYTRFDRVVLTHTSRLVNELVHAEHITHELPRHELLGEMVRERLIYYPSVTGEPFRTSGRITVLIESGRMSADLGLPPLDPTTDRAMICGSTALLVDLGALLVRRGFREGSLSRPGEFVIEKAFVAR
jgi:ferredoxin/flavodoxin---NADP+ reductase